MADPTLTIIMVSYNTRALTLAAIRTCLETTRETAFTLVVFDNASTDGSAEAIDAAFGDDPRVALVRSDDNLGFARANNVVAETARGEFLLLLNPDTECHAGAVDGLMAFARAEPQAGIWGGRTVFPDGTLNIASCWNRVTLWSTFCWATGLSSAFRGSEFFNPEAMGGWQRDSVRQVDIVVGCFLLIPRALWEDLGGFDLKYFMYGEEADLCLRAAARGHAPMVTPEAQIMHVVGAAAGQRSDKRISVLRAKATLMRDHWPRWQVPLGLGLMWVAQAARRVASRGAAAREIWAARRTWLGGYE
ncbi:MAG: glycosyltransferase family 2 protein [Pseudomonadota bacterium]